MWALVSRRIYNPSAFRFLSLPLHAQHIQQNYLIAEETFTRTISRCNRNVNSATVLQEITIVSVLDFWNFRKRDIPHSAAQQLWSVEQTFNWPLRMFLFPSLNHAFGHYLEEKERVSRTSLLIILFWPTLRKKDDAYQGSQRKKVKRKDDDMITN